MTLLKLIFLQHKNIHSNKISVLMWYCSRVSVVGYLLTGFSAETSLKRASWFKNNFKKDINEYILLYANPRIRCPNKSKYSGLSISRKPSHVEKYLFPRH